MKSILSSQVNLKIQFKLFGKYSFKGDVYFKVIYGLLPWSGQVSWSKIIEMAVSALVKLKNLFVRPSCQNCVWFWRIMKDLWLLQSSRHQSINFSFKQRCNLKGISWLLTWIITESASLCTLELKTYFSQYDKYKNCDHYIL